MPLATYLCSDRIVPSTAPWLSNFLVDVKCRDVRTNRDKGSLASMATLRMQIGKGGYGDVFLARKTDTKELCALKRMKKAALIKQDEVCEPA
jgi:hypothetical protein